MSEATLIELSEKLSELRQHLEQVRLDLVQARAGDSRFRKGSVRCHTCGRKNSSDEAGWSLRLCSDDELHLFCPDCQSATVIDARLPV